MKGLSVLILFLGIFIHSCAAVATFISPTSEGIYYNAFPFDVTVDFSHSLAQSVTVTITGLSFSRTITIYRDSNDRVVLHAGNYVFSGVEDGTGLQMTSVNIKVYGLITITSPAEGAKLAAGSPATVTWTVEPSSPTTTQNYAVTLSCPGFPDWTEPSTTALTINLNVPYNYYGSDCSISVSSEDYGTRIPLSVIVTQMIQVLSPVEGFLATVGYPVPVGLYTNNAPSISAVVETLLSCGSSGSDSKSFPLNRNNNFYPPTTLYGECQFSIINAPDYLAFPSTPTTIYLKYRWTIIGSNKMYLGQVYNFNYEITPAVTPGFNEPVYVQLNCGNRYFLPLDPLYPTGPFTGSFTVGTNAPVGPCSIQSRISSQYYFDGYFLRYNYSPVEFTLPIITEYVQPDASFQIELISTLIPPQSGDVNVQFYQDATGPLPFSVTIATPLNFVFSPYSYGSFKLETVDNYFGGTNDMIITIRYQLTISELPDDLIVGYPFPIFLDATSTLPGTLTSTSVVFSCLGTNIRQRWDNVPFGTTTYLKLSGFVPPPTSTCWVQTFGDDDFYLQAYQSVKLRFARNPVGEDLYPISRAEVIQFCKSLVMKPLRSLRKIL